tara:strand:- start:455 stop:592 length:138 start_codon:yes stop_codon:yes gene_type:complete
MPKPKEKSLQEIIEEVEKVDEDILQEMEDHIGSLVSQDLDNLLED